MADDDAKDGDAHLDEMLAAWIQSKGMDRIAAYVARGRKFGACDLDALQVEWIRAHRHWYANWGDADAQQNAGDADAEFELRRERQPVEAVEADMRRLREEALALANEIRTRTVNWEKSGEAVEAELHAFLKTKKKAIH